MESILENLGAWLQTLPEVGRGGGVLRYVVPLLAILIVARCAVSLLLLFSLLAAVLGFAMPVQAAGNDGKALRTVRVGYYAYTGYNMMDADGNRSGYAYDMLQRIGQAHANFQHRVQAELMLLHIFL